MLRAVHPEIAKKYCVFETVTLNVNSERYAISRATNYETNKSVVLLEVLRENECGYCPHEYATAEEALQHLSNFILNPIRSMFEQK